MEWMWIIIRSTPTPTDTDADIGVTRKAVPALPSWRCRVGGADTDARSEHVSEGMGTN